MRRFVDSTSPVRSGEELDTAALARFLNAHLGRVGSLQVEQFPSGYSNLTYLLRLDDRELVLRRPPFGNRVKSAHDMGREYRVLSNLSKVYDLAPCPLIYCGDESIVGAPFYVMERHSGIILRRQLPEGFNIDPDRWRRLGESFVDNLAGLHAIDFAAAGLADLGKPNRYVERQVAGWIDRYQRSQTDRIAEIENVVGWLAENKPPDSSAALVHNDYKYDNLVLDPADVTKIIAVLDWEMCTLGDPLMDLGSTLAYWVQPDDPDELKQCAFGPTTLPGNLTRAEIVERYNGQTGRDVSDVLFYYCYGLFKLAVIIQQIYFRFVQGHTRDPRFANLNLQVAVLGRTAATAVEMGRLG